MGTVVRKLPHLTPRTTPRQVFSPTRKYAYSLIYCILVTGAVHPAGIEGAN